MHDSRTIANRFLDLAEREGARLTPMQLIKLVYIAHGWSLGLFGRPLVRDRIEAWQYGPVLPKLYEEVRAFRGEPVTELLSAPLGEALSQEDDDLLRDVFRRYGPKDGVELSRLTHAPGTPWSRTYRPGSFGNVIPEAAIKAYYQHLADSP